MYQHRNNALSKVRAGRLPGEARLELVDASSFGDPTPEEPIRASVFRNRRPVGIYRCEGRDGNALLLTGAIEGFVDDVVILPGDDVANVLTAADLDDLIAAIKAIGEGADGAPGSVWRDGFGPPSDELGIDGDYYLEHVTGDVYQREDGSYSVVANMLGPIGPKGDDGESVKGDKGDPGKDGSVLRDGAGAPADELGVDGDYYLNRVNGDLYLRASGAYSVVANLKGPKGDAGGDGAPGSVLRSGEDVPSDALGVDGDYYFRTGVGDVHLRSDGSYAIVANLKGPKGDPGADGQPADESNLVHINGAETINGAKTFAGGATVKAGLSIHDSVGAVASGFDADGHGFVQVIRFRLALGVDLTSGTNLVAGGLAPFAGKVVKVQIKANSNGAAGGFSIQLKKNGSTNLLASPYAVAASDTAVKTVTSFAADGIASGDWLSVDASSVGAGVQDVEIAVTVLGGNR